jgi:SAM-dependent methyltransferase
MTKARDMLNLEKNLTIIDVGGRSLVETSDRSYKNLFKDNFLNYYVVDIEAGHNVTHVMPGMYILPFESNSIDLVVSGQTLEHVKNPFKMIDEMKRVLKVGSYMIIIAPSAGRRHDAVDCWRFMDDSFKAIAEDIGDLEVVADWIDRNAIDERSSQWKDHVFIGKKLC